MLRRVWSAVTKPIKDVYKIWRYIGVKEAKEVDEILLKMIRVERELKRECQEIDTTHKQSTLNMATRFTATLQKTNEAIESEQRLQKEAAAFLQLHQEGVINNEQLAYLLEKQNFLIKDGRWNFQGSKLELVEQFTNDITKITDEELLKHIPKDLPDLSFIPDAKKALDHLMDIKKGGSYYDPRT